MRIAISGSHGLIGSALKAGLQSAGHEVFGLVRSLNAVKSPDLIAYDPAAGFIEYAKMEGLDVVINFAGESIASGPWSKARKQAILDSRIHTTSYLVSVIQHLRQKPSLFVNASAVGFYGPLEAASVDEGSRKGTGFLSDVCLQWEKEALHLKDAGIRIVCLRLGVVLSPAGGMLAKLLPPFRLGLGGPVGDGRQGVSWIALSEIPEIMSFVIKDQNISGPVNVCTPEPVSNAEFGRTLARVLGRPYMFRVPAYMIRMLLGEMGQELILAGAYVKPTKLLQAGYRFHHPKLEEALRGLLNKP